MSLFILGADISFPHPSLSDKDGLLAVGGDLSAERLLNAYANGIFPWFGDDSPILWWSPDPRMILFPREFKRSKSLKQTLKKEIFEVRFDHDFPGVIRNCSEINRKGEGGTWITREMISAYIDLHESGYAHSVEAYKDGQLAGGLYGVSIGRAFFGESMFFRERDASKVALSALVDRMLFWEFQFIDAQQCTEHLRSLGASPLPRSVFLDMLMEAVKSPSVTGKW
jgi:leucyl/phenylalanyl-tRNA--protein transferase